MDCDLPDHDLPDYRATILRDGTLRVIDWGPWLATGGPLYTLLHARGSAGIAIADLTVVRDDDDNAVELVVELHCGGDDRHRAALRDWAARVGYRRIWLGGEVEELEPRAGGAIQTRCSGCRVRFVDAGVALWEFVRNRGAFPSACVLCGCDLPQWTKVRRPARRARGDAPATTARSSACM